MKADFMYLFKVKKLQLTAMGKAARKEKPI